MKDEVNELENNNNINDFKKGNQPGNNREKDRKNGVATDSGSILGR